MLGALLVINIAGEKMLSYLYLKNRSGQSGGKINYFLRLEPKPEVLIMGNSRALYQIIPDSFANANIYNLCHAGMDDCFQLGLLHYIIKSNKAPKVILLQIDPEYYIKKEDDKEFISTDIQHLKYYYNKDSLVKFHINQMSPFEKFKNAIPLYKFNGRVISLLKNLIVSDNKVDKFRGFVKVAPTKFDSINTINSFKERAPKKKFEFNPENTKYLKDFIAICKQNDIQLICFTSPHYKYNKDYYSHLKSNIDLVLANNNIAYIDFDEQVQVTKLLTSPVYWKDCMHLNLHGAAIESAYLANLTDSLRNNKMIAK